MRHLITFLAIACAMNANAQKMNKESRYIEYQEYQINKNYSDSLVVYKDRLDCKQPRRLSRAPASPTGGSTNSSRRSRSTILLHERR